MNKKLRSEETARRRTRKTTKFARAIVGVSIEELRTKRQSKVWDAGGQGGESWRKRRKLKKKKSPRQPAVKASATSAATAAALKEAKGKQSRKARRIRAQQAQGPAAAGAKVTKNVPRGANRGTQR
eukprot:scaffold913_cov233-Pinguiococcus_pyrenoidosus.AAC.2